MTANNNINGRTPEEIKKGLELCTEACDGGCDACAYDVKRRGRGKLCVIQMRIDALAYIQQLEAERDAAVEMLYGKCFACKHSRHGKLDKRSGFCQRCLFNVKAVGGYDLDYYWQYRGVEVE